MSKAKELGKEELLEELEIMYRARFAIFTIKDRKSNAALRAEQAYAQLRAIITEHFNEKDSNK